MTWWLWLGDGYLDVGVLLMAVALDAVLPEPPSVLHPVVWMGRLTSLLEQFSPRSGRVLPFLAGVSIAIVVPSVFGGAVWWLALGLREFGSVAYILGTAVLLKTTFTVKGLSRAALKTGRALESGDLEEARQNLKSLVSRDTKTLTAPLMASAAVESVAENITDSYIGPWLAFGLLGLPGAFGYRALNTLDSMLGYHGCYEYLGKASARLDDLANLVAARLSALLMVVAGAMMRLPVGQGWERMWKEHNKTESPNAGWTMSTMAGLLGVALEKPEHYRLGEGLREPVPGDIRRAVMVNYAASVPGVMVTAGLLMARQMLAN
ncbi:MAG: cobalamin biosynthesis protein CobD [Deinococcus sp.]|nr:cobalamin biosynthesis protein CobD [Deinococcus sp.]